MKIIDIFPTADGIKSKEKECDPFNPAPVLSQDTLVPYDLPVFPLVRRSIQKSDGFDAYKEAAPKAFKKITKVGGLSFKKTVEQKEKAPDKQFADAFTAYRGGESFQVELYDTNTKGVLTQIWQEGAPWAVYSETYGRKARLVEATPAVPQKNNSRQGGER